MGCLEQTGAHKAAQAPVPAVRLRDLGPDDDASVLEIGSGVAELVLSPARAPSLRLLDGAQR
jgi:hypothetical protein